MTSRENRKQRREAERKARKLANKQPHNSPAPPSPSPAPSESRPATPAFIAEMRAKADRELDEEFGVEFMAHAREVSDRMARRFGLPLWGGSRAVDVQPEPRPAANTVSEIAAQQTQCGTENPIPTPRPASQKQNPAENRLSTSPMGQIRQNAQEEPASLPEPKIKHGSTGPRTLEGKLASSRNSLKHGLAANVRLIPGEAPAAFETLRTALLHGHQPADATEQILVDQLAQSYWLLQRALRFQNNCFTLAAIDSKIEVDEKRLALFIRYGTTHERAFHKALNTLLRLKRDRQKAQSASTHGFVSQKQAPPSPQPPSYGFVSQIDGFPDTHSARFTGITPRNSPASPEKLPEAA